MTKLIAMLQCATRSTLLKRSMWRPVGGAVNRIMPRRR